MPDNFELEKYNANNEINITTETGFVSEVIDSDGVTAIKGVIQSNAKMPKDIDICIVKTLDVSDGVIKATGTNIKYNEFSVEIHD